MGHITKICLRHHIHGLNRLQAAFVLHGSYIKLLKFLHRDIQSLGHSERLCQAQTSVETSHSVLQAVFFIPIQQWLCNSLQWANLFSRAHVKFSALALKLFCSHKRGFLLHDSISHCNRDVRRRWVDIDRIWYLGATIQLEYCHRSECDAMCCGIGSGQGWLWKQLVPPKRRHCFTIVHDVILQIATKCSHIKCCIKHESLWKFVIVWNL
jgi:hypothetical protein